MKAKRQRALFTYGCAVVLVGLVSPVVCEAAEDEHDPFDIWVADRFALDDNLYRLPDDLDPQLSPAPDGRRGDYVNRLSAGLDASWDLSRQAVKLNLRMDQNRFARNDHLDNTSGNAKAEWAWRLGSNWKGDVGADYARSLAGFANTRFRERDVLETTGAFWSTSFTAGRWTLRGAARQSETEHGAATRQFDNSQTRSGSFGIQYTTPSENTFGLDYRYSKASFDRPALLNDQLFDRNYEENTAGVRVGYALGPKTTLKASGGYLKRKYPDAVVSGIPKGSFEGGVWEAALQWQPTIKLGMELGGWRKLRAYLDAESDYFVAQGYSIAPVWNPTNRLRVTFEASYEQQDYLGSSVNLLVPDSRHDRVRGGELSVTYRAWRMVHFDLSGRMERRDSDRNQLQYDSRIASFSVRLTF